jgi:hypothetical protein
MVYLWFLNSAGRSFLYDPMAIVHALMKGWIPGESHIWADVKIWLWAFQLQNESAYANSETDEIAWVFREYQARGMVSVKRKM